MRSIPEPCSVAGRLCCIGILALLACGVVTAAETERPAQATTSPLTVGLPDADAMLADYFRRETARLEQACLAEIQSADDWQQHIATYREQLFEMLGLDPLPERTDLQATVTGTVAGPGFRVENLHFQSRPGLYVTGNLYVPTELDKPAPAILYLCGHGRVVKDGVSYGNKTHYQHHGIWFAQHGYVCLVIDTLQLGEIEGLHHGTHREGMWWWNSRGYTPAGVEAWNSIRAVDYLLTRPEVDPQRIGMTGRSGGGSYSWTTAALDPRIQAIVPVAGITDLRNYVVDGAITGHCDCMFTVNTYRWDYPQLAALIAPRALLLANSDQDTIFPLDGVVRTQFHLRRIYDLLDARKQLGLHVTSGPHSDTPELQVGAFAWLNRHLQGETGEIQVPAGKLFEPKQLKVFEQLPSDERNTTAHEWFVPLATESAVPTSWDEFVAENQQLRDTVRQKTFAAWPADEPPLYPTLAWQVERAGYVLRGTDFQSQPGVKLRAYALFKETDDDAPPRRVVLQVVDEAEWTAWAQVAEKFQQLDDDAQLSESELAELFFNTQVDAGDMLVVVPPRGVGPSAWTGEKQARVHQRRRFMLLGQTLDGMRVWDVQRAVQTLKETPELVDVPVVLRGAGNMAGVALYAAMFSDAVEKLQLDHPAANPHEGPELLNVLRFLNLPRAVAMVGERIPVELQAEAGSSEAWNYLRQTAEKFPAVLHVDLK